jgi:hypothetical protein
MKRTIIFLFFVVTLNSSEAQAYKTSDPDSIKIITTDITNFWDTFDRLSNARTLSDSIEIIQKYYLDKASYGLQEYVKASNSTPKDFSKAIKSHRNYLESIRKTTTSIQDYKNSIVDAAKKLKSMYPLATFPQIYFVMGKFEVRGSEFTNFLYIGAELMCASANSPLEINKDLKPQILPINDIATVCIHEIIHYQQKYQDPKNILEEALIEGGADFITKQITGKATAQSCFDYGYKNEKQLWTEFKSQDSSQDYRKWFVDLPDTIHDRPGMLGYFIGYRICEQYYRNSTSKNRALKEIIGLNNPLEIYKKSKYKGD